MNKQQELAIQQIKAMRKVQEEMKQHEIAWRGADPTIIGETDSNDAEELFDSLEE